MYLILSLGGGLGGGYPLPGPAVLWAPSGWFFVRSGAYFSVLRRSDSRSV